MKNLLTYVSPDREFNAEHQMLAKIQIDNSLALGWKPEDILLVTNFPYEYNGIRSITVSDTIYCPIHWPATKVNAIVHMFDTGLIGDEIYWYHDFDCYQLVSFREGEPDLGGSDFGLTNYSRMPRLCSASIFFKRGARDIFGGMKHLVDTGGSSNEELAIAKLLRNRRLRKRIKHLNITWAFHRFNLRSCWKIAEHPIRATHFHATPDKYDFYVRGNNKLNVKIIPDELVDIFHEHGFQG